MTNRHHNWAYALGAYIASVHHSPFAYGKHDCGLLSAGAIQALTGVDPMPTIKYESLLQLTRELKRVFGSSYLDDVAAKLAMQHNWKEVDIKHAHRGDLIVIGTGRDARLGIVSMRGTHIMTPGDKGLIYEPFSRANKNLKAYSI